MLIAGREGNQTAELRARIATADLGAVVRLLGPRDDVADLLCAADVACAPSRWEGFPGAVLEAMALGTPVVTTEVPGTDEVLGVPAVGRRVPSNDPGRLAAALIEVLDDPDAAAVMASAGRERFLEHFTLDRVVDRMVEFYERAVFDAGR